jgi:hypothetical protein
VSFVFSSLTLAFLSCIRVIELISPRSEASDEQTAALGVPDPWPVTDPPDEEQPTATTSKTPVNNATRPRGTL